MMKRPRGTHKTKVSPEEDLDTMRQAKPGDVVRILLNLVPEDGFVPESLFDTTGEVTLVLGWGNYLPALHDLLEGCTLGDVVESVSIDAGWGARNEELVVETPKEQLSKFTDVDKLKVGRTMQLTSSVMVSVVEIKETTVVVDANPPLAGSSYSCSFTVLAIDDLPMTSSSSPYEVCTVSGGCFWGLELAFLRQAGVVGTQVGYSHGTTSHPTYDEVCEGTTRHRETVMIVYDPQVVKYAELLELALKRMAVTAPSWGIHQLFDADHAQYRYGFYYHNDEQRSIAQEVLAAGNRLGVEVLEATEFYPAEDYHQKYLYKRGQSTRKGAKETIRCYG